MHKGYLPNIKSKPLTPPKILSQTLPGAEESLRVLNLLGLEVPSVLEGIYADVWSSSVREPAMVAPLLLLALKLPYDATLEAHQAPISRHSPFSAVLLLGSSSSAIMEAHQ